MQDALTRQGAEEAMLLNHVGIKICLQKVRWTYNRNFNGHVCERVAHWTGEKGNVLASCFFGPHSLFSKYEKQL